MMLVHILNAFIIWIIEVEYLLLLLGTAAFGSRLYVAVALVSLVAAAAASLLAIVSISFHLVIFSRLFKFNYSPI